MDIETSGAIKLFFPNPSLTLVYFEALANALDAGATEVSIDIDVQAYDKPDTLKIADIWQALIGPGAEALGAVAEQTITATTVNSRSSEPGSLFIALQGERTDGHLYLRDAFSHGAAVAIAEPRSQELCDQATFVMPDGTLRDAKGAAQERAALPLVFIVPDSLTGLQRLAGAWRQVDRPTSRLS